MTDPKGSPERTSGLSRLRLIGDWFLRLLDRPVRVSSRRGTAGTTDRPKFLDPLLEGFLEKAARQNAQLRDVVHDLAQRYWETGYEDAVRGQRRAQFQNVAQAAASLLRREALSMYNAKKAQFDRARETKELVLEMAQARFKTQDHHLQYLARHFRENPSGLSRTLWIGYLSIAILLIAADIPLALKLTQVGFDLDLGHIWKIRDFIYNPWAVFRENWEVFLLAGGLALCTVYIKIFYDRYTPSFAPQLLPELENTEHSSPLPNRMPLGAHAWFSRSVFALTLGTIVLVGLFRFTTIEYLRLARGNTSAALSPSIALLGNATFRAIVTCATFILITLLFPIIGGICLSLGLNQQHNRRAFRRAKRALKDAGAEYKEASADVESLRETATDWDGMLRWCEGNDFLRATAELLHGSYNHGYERGWMETLRASFDPLEFATLLRSRAVAHRVCEWINRGSSTRAAAQDGHPPSAAAGLGEKSAEPTVTP